jgi:DNA-directed RNA polymerase specialized sigma24 family protein
MQAEGDVVRLPVAEEQAPPDFAAFFAEEHRGLFKALYFVTGNRADAAELMQDAFLKLWERWDRVDRLDDPTGYLFRVALNGFRMRTRAAIRATRRLVPLASTTDPRPARHVRLRLRGGRTDDGHPSVDRPRARDAGPCRAPQRRPACLS